MKVEHQITLETNGITAYKMDGDDVVELEAKDKVVGDNLIMLAGDIKELVGQDLKDIVKMLISLVERIEALEARK